MDISWYKPGLGAQWIKCRCLMWLIQLLKRLFCGGIWFHTKAWVHLSTLGMISQARQWILSPVLGIWGCTLLGFLLRVCDRLEVWNGVFVVQINARSEYNTLVLSWKFWPGVFECTFCCKSWRKRGAIEISEGSMHLNDFQCHSKHAYPEHVQHATMTTYPQGHTYNLFSTNMIMGDRQQYCIIDSVLSVDC